MRSKDTLIELALPQTQIIRRFEMGYSSEYVLKKSGFSDKQTKAILKVYSLRTEKNVNKSYLEKILSKLEIRILNRIYIAFSVQMGLLIALILGLN